MVSALTHVVSGQRAAAAAAAADWGGYGADLAGLVTPSFGHSGSDTSPAVYSPSYSSLASPSGSGSGSGLWIVQKRGREEEASPVTRVQRSFSDLRPSHGDTSSGAASGISFSTPSIEY